MCASSYKILCASLLVFTSSGIYAASLETTPDDNPLWRSLTNCQDMSLDCFKTEFTGYLSQIFESRDLQVSSFLNFRKNNVDYAKWQSETTSHNSEEDLAGTSPRAANPLEEVTNSVKDKMREFFVTHDMQIALPEFIAEGASVRIAPRAFQDGGALVKLDLTSEEELDDSLEARSSSVGSPRLFKKIRKFIGERLMWALAALVLVVKLLSLKFMFFLPVIMGVAAAKKLLLKVILFVFPFLGHLFKLCPYYAGTKYHHHHHQIAHLHQLPPHLHDLHAGGIELDHPPPGWHDGGHEHAHHHGLSGGEYSDDLGYYSDGPGFGAHELGLRRKQQALQNEDDDGYPPRRPPYGGYPPEVKPYGPKGIATSKGVSKIKVGALSPAEIENMVLKAEKEAMLKARLQEEQKRVEVENKLLQDKIKNSLKFQEKLKIQSLVAKQTSKLAAAYQPPPLPPPSAHQLIPPPYVNTYLPQPHSQPIYGQPVYNSPTVLAAMQDQLQNSPIPPANKLKTLNSLETISKSGVTTANVAANTRLDSVNSFDPFYSPILQKIDKIFNELVIVDENCRERLVCNMYSEPEKYSPHSNLISAELSRDASELQKPLSSNSAVIRFYKYVQAARDGQDKRACATLYPACTLSI